MLKFTLRYVFSLQQPDANSANLPFINYAVSSKFQLLWHWFSLTGGIIVLNFPLKTADVYVWKLSTQTMYTGTSITTPLFKWDLNHQIVSDYSSIFCFLSSVFSSSKPYAKQDVGKKCHDWRNTSLTCITSYTEDSNYRKDLGPKTGKLELHVIW